MELSNLLGTRFACDCGREHDLPVRRFVYEAGAIEQLGEIVSEADAGRVTVVADTRTWAVAGEKACNVLREAGIETEEILVTDPEGGGPVCDEVTCAELIDRLRGARPAMVVAAGSGVINDLCKWSSFELGVPYAVVATAASMNGYAAANVAARVAGVKVLVEARPPVAVVAEPDVITGAPREMTTAGFGDTIAKYQSGADWLMNHLLLDEYYCAFCAGIVNDLEPLYLERPEDIAEGKRRAVGGLFEALFWSGVAMTVVGTSAPASGGEHLLSHTLDMVADARGAHHDLHGRQVGVGTIVSAALYERVLALESPEVGGLPEGIDPEYWGHPGLVEAVGQQYTAKRASVDRVRKALAAKDTWDLLRARLAEATKRPGTVRDWLRRAGGAVTPGDVGCSREALRAAMLHMHEMRRRLTIVDLAWMVGVLPAAADEIIDAWLTS
jgi:glycerol-1-phosphate dehydrogenase [NAD(P)+]